MTDSLGESGAEIVEWVVFADVDVFRELWWAVAGAGVAVAAAVAGRPFTQCESDRRPHS